MLRNTMAMLPQVVVAPRSTVTAHNVDFAIWVSQLDQQIVKKIKLLHVIIFYIAGAVIAEKMVQLRDAIRKILIAYTVRHVDTFTGMKMVEMQAVGREVRAQRDRSGREHTEQTEADKELSEDGVIASHRGPGLYYNRLHPA
jgi:hypothetical protein